MVTIREYANQIYSRGRRVGRVQAFVGTAALVALGIVEGKYQPVRHAYWFLGGCPPPAVKEAGTVPMTERGYFRILGSGKVGTYGGREELVFQADYYDDQDAHNPRYSGVTVRLRREARGVFGGATPDEIVDRRFNLNFDHNPIRPDYPTRGFDQHRAIRIRTDPDTNHIAINVDDTNAIALITTN